MAHNIHIRFFAPEREALFQKCLAAIPHAANVIVQPLDRVGYSGASVFVFFPHGEHSNPHVGKIHNKEGITREVSGRDLAYHFFQEATQMRFHVEADGGLDLAILATPLIPNDQNSVTELKDVIYLQNKKRPNAAATAEEWFEHPIDFVTGIYRQLYERNCRKCFAGVTRATKVLGQEYKWYLRDNRSERLIRGWLGASVDRPKVDLYGETVSNPLLLIKRLLNVERTLPISTVHGDLHLSNVVLDGRNDPHLIDFYWCAKDAHILKDFLVMECSIRFFMLPRHISREVQKVLDTSLLDPTLEKIDDMIGIIQGKGLDQETIFHIERCAKLVLEIRAHAARACGNSFDLRDYLACQALVLYGLIAIYRYPFEASVCALGLIAEFLERVDYFVV